VTLTDLQTRRAGLSASAELVFITMPYVVSALGIFRSIEFLAVPW